MIAVQNDITYDSTQIDLVAGPGGTLACAVNGDIGPGTPIDKTLLISVTPSAPESKRVRILLLGLEADQHLVLPDGFLYVCRFRIQAGATNGVKVLSNRPIASFATEGLIDLIDVPVAGTNGEIVVPCPGGSPLPPQSPVPPTRMPESPPTVSPTPMKDPRPDPGEEPVRAVHLSRTCGSPGEVVEIAAELEGESTDPSLTIVSIQNDIWYDPMSIEFVAKENGNPDCWIDPGIGRGTSADKILTANRRSPSRSPHLRVGVFGLNVAPIPPGTLYTCRFQIRDSAARAVHALDVEVLASTAEADSVLIASFDGEIAVPCPEPD